jgi:hypothetical protein
MNLKRWFSVVLLLILLGVGAWWCFGRGPQAEVLAAQAALLKKVEKRAWGSVKARLAEDYRDDYGHDRESAIEDAQTAFGGFLSLKIQGELDTLQAVPDLAMVKMRLRLEGHGLGFSDVVVARLNQLNEPWFFHWHKRGIWPWSWRLVQVHHNELHLAVPQ